MNMRQYEFWFIAGLQHLYGPETLEQVAAHAAAMTEGLNQPGALPYKIVYNRRA